MSKILDIQKRTLEREVNMKDGNREVIGKAHPIKDSNNIVTGRMKYVGDIELAHMLHAKELYSPHAHAKIISIDTSKAEELPGVRAVISHENVTDRFYNSSNRFWDQYPPENEQVYPEIVRYVGDRVASVAADTKKIAEEAIKLIDVQYEVLPAVFDPEEALKEDAPILHGDTNLLSESKSEAGDPDKYFKKAYKVYEGVYEVPPIHHGALENHVALADYDHTGKLTMLSPTQNVFSFRLILSKITGLPINKIRVIRPAIGGAFGGKLETVIEPVVAILSMLTKRPVRLELTRKESITSTKTRHAARMYYKSAVDREGNILAQDFDIILNSGAYAGSAMNVLGALSHKIYKLHKTENMRFRGRTVMTNIPVGGAMRAFGSPQVFFGQQVQFAEIAEDLGIDLVDLHRKNLVDPEGVDVRFDSPLHNPRPKDALNKGAELFKWEEKKKNLKKDGDIVEGIGMAVATHGNGVYGAHRDYITLMLGLNEDGSFTLNTGVHEMGQGIATMQTMIIAEEMGVTADWVETVEADTDACLWNLGDYASRGAYVEGGAAKKTAHKLQGRMKDIAVELIDTKKDDMIFKDGCIIDETDPNKKVSFNEVAVHSQSEHNKELTIIKDYASPAGVMSYGAHFAKVEVNKKDKTIKIVDYTAVHDIGKVINPLGAEGQLEGGIMMGIGQALDEGFKFDEEGGLLTDNFRTYKLPRITDMPNCNIGFVEEGTYKGPYGAKSIGECSVVPSIPAVVNAVADAIGKPIKETPINLDKYL